jgi:hypothetical protein
MKIILKYKIYLIALFLLMTACSSRDITYNVTGLSFEGDGYFNIEIWNVNEGISYEPEQALKDALQNILYFGVLSNNKFTAQKPLLLTEENRNNFKKVENDFFKDEGNWSKFVRMSSTQSASTLNINKKEVKVYQVSISKDLLRKYLEEKNILNPITKGF